MNRLTLVQTAGSRVISVLSGKGGVGKSVISYNLADRLGARGDRVLLVDADFSSGNLHILANVRCDVGVRQFAAGELSLAEAVTPVSEQIDLLASSWSGSVVDDFGVMPTAQLVRIIREQSGGYHHVIIDHGSGISKAATVMAHASDINLLVIVPELTSIADAYGLYKYLVETNKSIDCRLVVNRCQSDEEADYIDRKFRALAERFLRQSPSMLGFLPEADQVRAALARQVPIFRIDEQSPVCQTLTSIAGMLSGSASASEIRRSTAVKFEDKENPATADTKG